MAFLAIVAWRSARRLPLRQTAPLLALRGVTGLILSFILFNPSITLSPSQAAGKVPFLLLLDTSRSMCTADMEGSTRYDAARKSTVGNTSLLNELAGRFDLRLFGFTDRPEAATAETLADLTKPNGDRTNLGVAIAGAVAATGGRRGAGQILVVSDGRDTEDSFPMEAARAARNMGYTVSTLCVGKATKARDLQVMALRPQVYSAPGQTVQLGAEIRDSGIPRSRVTVDLLENGKQVASQTVAVEPGRREVQFPVSRPKKGMYRYAIAARPLPDEQNPANNRASIFLNVMNSKTRVLFLEGRPSWDSKFLVQTLRGDPAVSLDVIYKLTDSKFFAVVGGAEKEEGVILPRTPDQLAKYDLLILGKGFEEFYDDAGVKTLKEWIGDRGGNVIFLRGRADDRTPALRELEPVTWSDAEIADLRLRLTQEGRAHPAFAFAVSEDAQTVVRKLPPLISASRVQGEKALSVVLARAENSQDDQGAQEMATLAYQRYGQGKAMALAGQGLWRWAFLPPELQGYHKVYQEFWSQTVRWMVSESDFLPGQSLALRTDRSSYAVNETVTFLGYRRGAKQGGPPEVVLTRPDGGTDRIALAPSDGKQADFTAIYRPNMAGEYVASVRTSSSASAPISCMFSVTAGQEEDLNRSADPDLMRQLAAVGGGKVLTPATLAELPGNLRAFELAAMRHTEPQTVWDRPWVLAALLALLGAEWWLRRRSGLA